MQEAIELAALSDKLKRTHANGVNGLFAADELSLLAIAALHTAELRAPLLQVLLQISIDQSPSDPVARRAFMLLFQLGCSNSGTDVKVSPAPKPSADPVGVLVRLVREEVERAEDGGGVGRHRKRGRVRCAKRLHKNGVNGATPSK